jgi:amidase
VDGGEDIRRAVTEGGEPFLPHVEALVNRTPALSVYDYWQLNQKKVAAQQSYLNLWSGTQTASGRPIDIILAPTFSHTAVPHRSIRWAGYTKLFNLLDYSALSFPAGRVTKERDPAVLPEYEPRNPADAWNWQLYDLDLMDGHDIGLQIIGRRLEEEKVLGAALQVQRLMQNPS